MLTKVYGSAVFGVEATTITVEVNIDKGVGYHLGRLTGQCHQRKQLSNCRRITE